MTKDSASFSPFQIFTLCTVSSGLGTLCFAPFFSAGADAAWPCAVLITAIVSSAAVSIYMVCLKRSGCRSFDSALAYTLNPIASKIILFAFGLFFIAQSALAAYIIADATGMYLLEHTPRAVILLAVVITSCVVHSAGLKYTSRCCELLLMIIIIPLAVLLLLCLFNIDASEALVAVQPASSAVFRQLPAALLSCSGPAFIVFAAMQRHRCTAGAVSGYFCSAAVSIVLFICAAGIFTVNGTAVQNFPFIEMARSVSIGSISLTERFDTIFISVMFIAAIAQLSLLGSCSAHCLSNACGLRCQECFTWILFPVVFAAAYYAEYQNMRNFLMQTVFQGIIAVLFIIIPALCILLCIKSRMKGISGNA